MKKMLIGLIIFCVMFTACAEETEGSKEYYDKNYVLVYEVEGNFVDTEKKAKLYGYVGTFDYNDDGIREVICTTGDNFKKNLTVYPIDFWTVPFGVSAKENTSNSPLREIGDKIQVDDTVYGYIADINGNGLDELYLFTQVPGFAPNFFEYNPEKDAFESIIEYDGASTSLRLQSVDLDKKELTFKGFAIANTPVDEEVVYTWSDETGRYEITSRVRTPRQ